MAAYAQAREMHAVLRAARDSLSATLARAQQAAAAAADHAVSE